MDVKAREQKANETGNWIDKLQHRLSQAEFATDVAGAVPGPQSVVTEPINFAAGGTNLAIDGIRHLNNMPELTPEQRQRNNAVLATL